MIAAAGANIEIWRVHPNEIREQDLNARVMSPEMFDRLTETIKKEKRLESLPLAVKRAKADGTIFFELMSGHHRLRAARAAELNDIFILADTRDLDKSAVRAKQLAHNRISGNDDSEVLKNLYAEIVRVDDILESFVKPEDFDDVKQLDRASITKMEIDLGFRRLAFVFLPETIDRIDRLEEAIKKSPKDADLIGVVNSAIFEKFSEITRRLGRKEEIRSLGALVARMVEIVADHLGDDSVTAEPQPGAASEAKDAEESEAPVRAKPSKRARTSKPDSQG